LLETTTLSYYFESFKLFDLTWLVRLFDFKDRPLGAISH